MKLIADSHLDLAWNALLMNRDLTWPIAELNAREAAHRDAPGRGCATTTLPEMRRGAIAICLGTLVAGASSQGSASRFTFASVDVANSVARGQLNYYQRLAARGEIRLIGSGVELADHVARWQAADEATRAALPIGLVVAFEGCDAVTAPAEAADWFKLGLRCASLVHYGHGRYAGGTGTTAPLTDLGRELLAEFTSLGILLDVTHLSDLAFEQTLDAFGGVIFASHQNCRELVPGGRQFSDWQLQQVIARDGVIGVAGDAWMLSAKWPSQASGEAKPSREIVPISTMADHIDHICQLAGNALHAAIGSDLDGGFGTEQTPHQLDTIADLQRLDAILSQRGYSTEDVDRILSGNWIRFLQQHLANVPCGG
ncbi:dipeptidase [Lacipirellula parvula]|uniref:Peptidase n=1 Tax=Lacipirellula parvula TaxID=2650471 RepID=A0A5K7XF44_9BACT|nr:membrane dipeptidase [Lacipirellula parvula]BBO32853.1 hypothetical protein PLANPX_2465 [Lacipirellula parvula]